MPSKLGRLAASHPIILITALAILSRITPWSLLHALHLFIAPFDTSGSASPTLRWDAIHFTAIATKGYEYEQQIAFQPGWPLLVRLLARMMGGEGDFSVERATRVGEVLAMTSYVGTAVMLYRLTSLISTPSFALTTTLLYLLPPCPAVLSSAYSEPLFALLTFTGFHLTLKRRYTSAAAVLAGATSIRATGVLAVGPVGWMMVFGDEPVQSVLQKPSVLLGRALFSLFPAAVVVSPFFLSQVYFYHALCTDTLRAAWCDKTIPLAYSHVQEKYWNVGMLNYWTMEQLPNILLAMPVLLVSFTGAYRFFVSYFTSTSRLTHLTTTSAISSSTKTGSPTTNMSSFIPLRDSKDDRTVDLLLPFYIHSTALTLLLLFSAHTQIALRVCVTDPTIWWSLSAMAFRWNQAGVLHDAPIAGVHTTASTAGPSMDVQKRVKAEGRESVIPVKGLTQIGKIWVWWTVIFGAISIVLWSGHYPPA